MRMPPERGGAAPRHRGHHPRLLGRQLVRAPTTAAREQVGPGGAPLDVVVAHRRTVGPSGTYQALPPFASRTRIRSRPLSMSSMRS